MISNLPLKNHGLKPKKNFFKDFLLIEEIVSSRIFGLSNGLNLDLLIFFHFVSFVTSDVIPGDSSPLYIKKK